MVGTVLALTFWNLSFQESRIYAVATSGMQVSDVSPRSSAACCGESETERLEGSGGPLVAGWVSMEEETAIARVPTRSSAVSLHCLSHLALEGSCVGSARQSWLRGEAVRVRTHPRAGSDHVCMQGKAVEGSPVP